MQEQNEVSGSRGQANFVWKCQFCKVNILLILRHVSLAFELCTKNLQRESTATIMAAPISYQQASPPTRQKIIEIDCRGLEFTEFQPEVCFSNIFSILEFLLTYIRENG